MCQNQREFRLQMKKIFYAFAIILIVLIITPNAVMSVSACADCDDHLTLSEILANIDPSLAEIDFDAILADVVQDGHEDELFIVISMQEVYGQTDVVSVQVVNEEQLELIIIYADDGTDLLLIMPLCTGLRCCGAYMSVVRQEPYFCWVRLTVVMRPVWRCGQCGREEMGSFIER